MPQLPTTANFATAAGSLWRQTFTLTDSDGTPIDLTGLAWEFVIRPTATDTTTPALVAVTTTPSSQGQIDVVPLTGSVTVTLTSAATTPLGKGARPYALWSSPGGGTQTTWAQGVFNTLIVAQP